MDRVILELVFGKILMLNLRSMTSTSVLDKHRHRTRPLIAVSALISISILWTDLNGS